jgi:hypothetical protein
MEIKGLKAGDLERVRRQAGKKPVREGLVDHPVFQTKLNLEAKE